MSESPHKLRIKFSDGTELEAEGTPEFIASERREFLGGLQSPRRPSTTAPLKPGRDIEPAWRDLIEGRGAGVIQLRAKLGGGRSEMEACLILIAASRKLLRQPKPTAAQLARWLRASGYPIKRVDRVIQRAIDRGDILASGSRRGRRYELSGPGLAKAFNLAQELSEAIGEPGTGD